MTPKSCSLNLNPTSTFITLPHHLKALMIKELQFSEPIPHWRWLLLGRWDVKKKIKPVLIRNWGHKSLQSQTESATAELFMQLFMQGIAPLGWAVCCCFCPKTPHQCWNRGLACCRIPADGKVLPFPLWRVQGLSQCLCLTRVTPRHGKWDINKAKAMQNLWPICKCFFWGYLFL